MCTSDEKTRFHGAWRSSIALASFVVLCVGGVSAQELTPSKIEVSKLGPQVGEIVPDFSLPDQHGKLWTRDSIMGAKGAMLVFVRSADW
jgi:hypothetical protein